MDCPETGPVWLCCLVAAPCLVNTAAGHHLSARNARETVEEDHHRGRTPAARVDRVRHDFTVGASDGSPDRLGVGFGALLVFVRRNSVRGPTTAAAIWVTAAIGTGAGTGLPVLAVGATAAYLLRRGSCRGGRPAGPDDVGDAAAGGVGVDPGLSVLIGQAVGDAGRGTVRQRLILADAGVD
jgi:hypothetical protein